MTTFLTSTILTDRAPTEVLCDVHAWPVQHTHRVASSSGHGHFTRNRDTSKTDKEEELRRAGRNMDMVSVIVGTIATPA